MVYALFHLDDKREAIVYERIIDANESKAKALTYRKRLNGALRQWLTLFELESRDKLDEKINLKVLDHGCGWGIFLMEASGPGIKAFGFDPTPWKAEWAKKHGILLLESEEELFENAPFNLVVSLSAIPDYL